MRTSELYKDGIIKVQLHCIVQHRLKTPEVSGRQCSVMLIFSAQSVVHQALLQVQLNSNGKGGFPNFTAAAEVSKSKSVQLLPQLSTCYNLSVDCKTYSLYKYGFLNLKLFSIIHPFSETCTTW